MISDKLVVTLGVLYAGWAGTGWVMSKLQKPVVSTPAPIVAEAAPTKPEIKRWQLTEGQVKIRAAESCSTIYSTASSVYDCAVEAIDYYNQNGVLPY